MAMPTRPERSAGGREFGVQFRLHSPAMFAHPEHHLGNQAGGDEERGGLENFQRFAGQFVLHRQQGPTEQQGKPGTGSEADEQGAFAFAGVVIGLQPGVENAGDQEGFEAFAPDDEECVTHAVLRCIQIDSLGCHSRAGGNPC
jgi:hypothetical protein